MTWTRAAACWLLAAFLLLVLRATAPAPEVRRGEDVASAAARPAGEVVAVAPASEPTPVHAYDLDPAKLDRVEVWRGDRVVVLERTGDVWRATAPGDRVIPAGLVQAFVQQLVDGGHGERIGDDASDPAFGLATPGTRIEAWSGDERLRLAVGARTPAGAAAYALLEPGNRVVLVGLNLLYYADLLLG